MTILSFGSAKQRSKHGRPFDVTYIWKSKTIRDGIRVLKFVFHEFTKSFVNPFSKSSHATPSVHIKNIMQQQSIHSTFVDASRFCAVPLLSVRLKTNKICFSASVSNLVNILSQLPTNLGRYCTLFDAIVFPPLRCPNHINIGTFEWKQPEVHWHTTNQFSHFGHRSVSSNDYPSHCCVVAAVPLLRFESFNIDLQSNREWEWVVRVRERRSIETERGRALAKWKWSCS